MTPVKVILTTVIATSFLAVLSLAVLWRSQVSTQLRLDRCVKKTALALKRTQEKIESGNHRILLERKAVAAALLTAPEAVPALQKIIATEVLAQQSLLSLWSLRQKSWILHRGCDGKMDYFFPLPTLDWFRAPPDLLGQQPLMRTPKVSSRMQIRIWKNQRKSSAVVENQKNHWRAFYAQF